MTQRWTRWSRPPVGRGVTLVCFPYAGGGASMFHSWPQGLPATVQVCAVCLPGRENRIGQPFATSVEEVTEAVLADLAPRLDAPLALFGHSMGAALAWSFAARLSEECGVTPLRLFASGAPAPRLADAAELLALGDRELQQVAVERWNNLPEAVLRDERLLAGVLATARADLALYAECARLRRPPLICPIDVFGGMDDPSLPPQLLATWSEYTTGPVETELFPGGHMFATESSPLVVAAMARRLGQCAPASSRPRRQPGNDDPGENLDGVDPCAK